MRRIVTLLFLSLFSFAAGTATAQRCPTPETSLAEKAGYDINPTLDLLQQTQVIFSSDLNGNQQMKCVAGLLNQNLANLNLSADEPLSSILAEDWLNDAWTPFSLAEPFYNDMGIETGFLSYTWDADMQDFVLEGQAFFSFDANGNLATTLIQDWNGTEMVNSGQIISELDEFGNQLRFELQFWENEAWEVFGQLISTVEDGLVTQIETITQDENGVLVPAQRQSFEHDDQNRVISEFQEVWEPDMQIWEIFGQILTAYADLSSVSTAQLYLGMDMSGNDTWFDFEQTTNNYNDQGLIVEVVVASLLAGSPDNQDRTTFAYNEMQLLTEVIEQVTDGMGGWLNEDGAFLTYDSDGDILEELNQMFVNGNWENDSRDTYSYGEQPTAVEDELSSRLASFDVYPSPARSRVQLEVNLAQPAALKVEVFDILGRQVKTLADHAAAAGLHQFAWDAEHVAAGMYFIRLRVDEKLETRPLLLTR